MANKYFNKQVAESRKPLNIGGPAGKKPAGWTLVKPSPTTKKSRMEERMKSSRPELKGMEGFKKVPKQDLKKYAPEFKKKSTLLPKSKKPESPERKKRQADYMKKHGKNEPRRKTLSVKNTYKKEVEGLKK